MGLPVMIMGQSGTGKSTSLRNFGADEITLINVNGKPLPFRTRFSHTFRTDDYKEIDRILSGLKTKVVVIDDSQYLMANEYMRRSNENGYQKFMDIGKNFWDLIHSVESLPEDVTVYFLHHVQMDENGYTKAKTIGKMLDEKINVEGMFSIVLRTVVTDGKYLFSTQCNGFDTCKSPLGLFEKLYIDNDLKLVDEAIRSYYQFSPEQICSDCGEPIRTDGKRTVEQIVQGSVKNYGKKLCMKCVMKKVKDNAHTS